MTILDKLMEKKDLKIYIDQRIKYLSDEKESEILKLPESERGFIQERFQGRILELKKLRDCLEKDSIKYTSKKYYKINMRK